jgi:Fe2+ transport system protein FeoA
VWSGQLNALDQLPVGARGRVSSVAGDDELSMRLLEMGLTPGVEVAVVGTAPLGDPLELELRGYRLSVRRSEAARVQVDEL